MTYVGNGGEIMPRPKKCRKVCCMPYLKPFIQKQGNAVSR